MPYGVKEISQGRSCNFDAVYEEIYRPAIIAAGLEPLRSDREVDGQLIHKSMFERLVLCQYALVDLSAPNPSVYYELGVRHVARKFSTVALRHEKTVLPFDVSPARVSTYGLGPDGTPSDPARDGKAVTEMLEKAREAETDSPVFQLLRDLEPPDTDRLASEAMRSEVEKTRNLREELAMARRDGIDALRKFRERLEPLQDDAVGTVLELFQAFRDESAWKDMILLAEAMDPVLARSRRVREQVGLALNRDGRSEEAELALRALIDEFGVNGEVCGILGRVYKDRWERARDANDRPKAKAALKKAIATYLQGFEADWRNAYPGIHAVTLMEVSEPPDERRQELLPVVTYAAMRSADAAQPNYWDYATLLELAVLREDAYDAEVRLGEAQCEIQGSFEPDTTAGHLRLIHEARKARGEPTPWLAHIIATLEDEAAARKLVSGG